MLPGPSNSEQVASWLPGVVWYGWELLVHGKHISMSLFLTYDSHGNIIHPLLPEIPVGFIYYIHVTSLGTTLVGDFTRRERSQVFFGYRTRPRKSRAGAIVANIPVSLTGKDPRIPIISITEISTVPRKSETVVDRLVEHLVGAVGVGVTHVIQDGHGKGALCAGGAAGGEAEGVGGGGAVGGLDHVVISCVVLEVFQFDVVEELAALCDSCC